MEEEDTMQICCEVCGSVGFTAGVDGFYYCNYCSSQAPDVIDTAIADEHFVVVDKGAMYLASNSRVRPQATNNTETMSQHESQSQLWSRMNPDQDLMTLKKEEDDPSKSCNNFPIDGVGPTSPGDFVPSGTGGSRALKYDDFFNEVRIRYALGLQLMVQLQCEALVRDFNVSPVVCGIAGTIWFRFLAATRIMADGWADEVLMQSESQKEGVSDNVKPRAKYRAEPHNIHGQRAVIVWFRSMQSKIPVSSSLAISFLACHVAREPILPTDVIKGLMEGKIPYFAAFLEIEKNFGSPSRTCPLSSSFMFRPSRPVPSQKLEEKAALIALLVGLDLPPVNFYAIASRYLGELSLPSEKIFPRACCLYDWSMPPNLWLSANESRFPTRVGVMSILIVTIRILYNIHGFGEWEKSLSNPWETASPHSDIDRTETGLWSREKDSKANGDDIPYENGNDSETEDSDCPKVGEDTSNILKILNAQQKNIGNSYEFNKDLYSYLKFCKEVVFAGLEIPFEDYDQSKVMGELWKFYQNNEDSEQGLHLDGSPKRKRLCANARSEDSPPRNNDLPKQDPGSPSLNASYMDHGDDGYSSAYRDKALQQLKADMEENRFFYIPPRVKVKRHDYLHYTRKRDEGSLVYIAHADYYVLLRACARVAEVDIRCMHLGVLDLERRLGWIENRIGHCLSKRPAHAKTNLV